MIKGTTPLHTFSLPFDTESVKTIQITYAQDDVVKLTKKNPDVQLSGNTASVKLTQEDTLKFNADSCVEIQVRVLTTGGDALASDIIKTGCRRILDDEVLV